ncbi:MAG TPA: YceH family protein [Noviherbaspirillum sp.]|uniref:YceH family protein n=1 Tax=Noviherbaspirillum sp. TaxID=1926288 RepID=UPI002D26CEE5|nr:YceH family protein [Noviherbaspirillum sp.]HYD96920.1 YceH family protein [Noviherbaspirillum sp.]
MLLDPFEVRVLAVLAEKEALTPDNYPLSLNALTNGCNQLSSRDPVMSLSEEMVQEVLQRLVDKKFVSEVRQAGARVVKYEHRMRMKWALEQDKLAVLTLLMLRGTQTAGEIRSRSGRLHDFASVADVEAALQFLIDKYPPLAARLPRAPGTKEARYAHLLCGEEMLERLETAAGFSASVETPRQDRVAQLEAEVALLRGELERLSEQFDSFRKQFD